VEFAVKAPFRQRVGTFGGDVSNLRERRAET
jgi:hypothetical protein